MADVIQLHFRPCVVTELRALADAIESGRVADVRGGAFVAEHADDTVTLTPMGDMEPIRCIGLLQLGTSTAIEDAIA